MKNNEINELEEFGLIKRISSKFNNKRKSTIIGIGDDSAVLNPQKKLMLLSSDMLIEGIHFDLSYSPLKHLGYKSVIVNLSDIYAMNAEPKQIALNLAISNKFTVDAIDEFYKGVSIACEEYSVDLVGGDTTSSVSGLTISCTAVGYAYNDEITKRDGAKINDIICVTGDLGRSFLGLKILQKEKKKFLKNPKFQPSLEKYKDIIEKQLRPLARKDIFDFLKNKKIKPNSMIDISDGLTSELIHISEASNLGFKIFENKIQISNELKNISKEFKINSLSCALNGGEEYELLFSLSAEKFEKIKKEKIDISPIGFFTDNKKNVIVNKNDNEIEIKSKGWNHFSR